MLALPCMRGFLKLSIHMNERCSNRNLAKIFCLIACTVQMFWIYPSRRVALQCRRCHISMLSLHTIITVYMYILNFVMLRSSSKNRWQTDVSRQLCVNWTQRFYNTDMYNNNFLMRVATDYGREIHGHYDQTSGVLPVSGTANVTGVTKFEVRLNSNAHWCFTPSKSPQLPQGDNDTGIWVCFAMRFYIGDMSESHTDMLPLLLLLLMLIIMTTMTTIMIIIMKLILNKVSI